jgi:hypothetical protein
MTVTMSEEGTAPLPALPGGGRAWRFRRRGPAAGVSERSERTMGAVRYPARRAERSLRASRRVRQ